MKTNLTIILLTSLCMGVLMGCTKPQTSDEQSTTNNQIAQDSVGLSDTIWLAFWLQDSLANVDPQMTILLDPIYGHDWPLYTDYNEYETVAQELAWVKEMQDTILRAYQMENADDTTQLQFVLDYIDNASLTWELGDSKSTREAMVKASIKLDLETYQTYLCLQHIYAAHDEKSINMLSQEFCGVEMFTIALCDFVHNLIYMQYFKGNLAQVVAYESSCSICGAELSLYKQETENPYLCIANDKNLSVNDCIALFREACEDALQYVNKEDFIRFLEGEVPSDVEEYQALFSETAKQKDIIFQMIDTDGFFTYRKERTKIWDANNPKAFKRANDARFVAFLQELISIVESTMREV